MYEVESSSLIPYNDIKDDPRLVSLLIHKFVKVELKKKISISGFIHSIDPIGHSIILLEPKDDNGFKTTILPGHAVLNILELNPGKITQPPITKVTTYLSQTCVEERKKKILSWFKQNLLPVSESDNNIVFGSVVILPPYSVNDICTDNPMVATQVISVLKNMPENI